MSQSDGRVYVVTGMSCEHCAASVSEEVAEVAGVRAVDVDLTAGRVTVRGEGFTDEAIHAAEVAIAMCQELGQRDLAASLQQELATYQSGAAYREAPR